MTASVFDMEVLDDRKEEYLIRILHNKSYTTITFSPESKNLVFINNDKITNYLKENEYQLRKILHNKRPDTFYKGFQLKFVIRDNKEVISFNDKSKIVVLDKRNGNYDSYVIDKGEDPIYHLFTDGCYLVNQKRGGFVALIRNLKNQYNLYYGTTAKKSSSLIEMLAAIKGLEVLKDIEKIRIVTDSRYVIKGLTEWVINWKLNKWHTAQGKKVKSITYWKEFDKLTNNKYIEFQWVKAHSFHFENTICDFYAKEAAKKLNHDI
jgi:ribonuclease HI